MSDTKPDTVWHYTIKGRLDAIETDGAIKPSTAGVPTSERPVVWFTANPMWEGTAAKLLRDGMGATLHDHWLVSQGSAANAIFQPARIAVAIANAPHRWDDFKRLSGVKPKEARRLYQVALSLGSRTGDWFCTFEPVMRDKWLSVQLYHGAEWRDHVTVIQ